MWWFGALIIRVVGFRINLWIKNLWKENLLQKPLKLFSVVLYSLKMKVWNCSLIDIVTLTKKSTENNFALVTLKIMTIKSWDEFGIRSK